MDMKHVFIAGTRTGISCIWRSRHITTELKVVERWYFEQTLQKRARMRDINVLQPK